MTMLPGTCAPRYLCSPAPLCSPVPIFPGTYVSRSLCTLVLCSPVPVFRSACLVSPLAGHFELLFSRYSTPDDHFGTTFLTSPRVFFPLAVFF